MMENFTHMLQHLQPTVQTPSTRNHLEGVTPFKVHVNLEISLFEGKRYANYLEKRLNPLEGYYFVKTKLDIQNIIFSLLKALPHVRDWWKMF
jgi:hypothetical protein